MISLSGPFLYIDYNRIAVAESIYAIFILKGKFFAVCTSFFAVMADKYTVKKSESGILIESVCICIVF